jgi:hypothetical protein
MTMARAKRLEEHWQMLRREESRGWGDTPDILRRRTIKGVTEYQSRTERYCYLDGLSPEEAIKAIQDAAEGLIDAQLQIENVPDYGGESLVQQMFGWVPVTDQRIIDKALKYEKTILDREGAWKRERAERELATIKKDFPELLK